MQSTKGIVKWFNTSKGYGFIQREGGPDVYVQYSDIIAEGFKNLEEGQFVFFDFSMGPKGLQAKNVITITERQFYEADPEEIKEYFGIGIFDGKLRLVSLGLDGQYKFIDGTENFHNILYVASTEALAIKQAIEELEYLINDPKSNELTLQKFFEKNPGLILNDEYEKAHAHITLARDEGSLIPDFLLEPVNQSTLCDILDLKLPSSKLFILKKNRMRYSAAVLEACAQLREYSDYFDNPNNRNLIFKEYGLLAYKPKMIVIIGRRGDIDPIICRKIQSDIPHLVLRSYDDVISMAQARIKLR